MVIRNVTARVVLLALVLTATIAHAQIPVVPNPDHEAMLRHSDPQLAKNKRLVYDFWRKPSPIEPRVKAPLVAIVADGDLVIMAFVREYPEPSDPAKRYTTTWFDMFRIVDGKIAEHWDPATKP